MTFNLLDTFISTSLQYLASTCVLTPLLLEIDDVLPLIVLALMICNL